MPEGGKCKCPKAAEGGYRKEAEGGYRKAAKVAEGKYDWYSMEKYYMVTMSLSHPSLLFTTAFKPSKRTKINCCIFLEKERGWWENVVWPIIDVGVLNSH